MNSAKITLTPIKPIENEEDVLELLRSYFGCLYWNGQILKNYELIKTNNGYVVFVTLPEDDSMDEKCNNEYNNKYTSDYLIKVKSIFEMHSDIIGENLEYRKSCTCERSSWYMLYTSFLDKESPVICGDCGKSVPLYKLPHLFEEDGHNGILGWKEAYSSMDKLWIYCLSDRFTYRELNNTDSRLSKIGLDICRELEKLTNTPVYYYVFQFGKSKEKWEKCPICGGDWKMTEENACVDYKCEECRLAGDEA